jgi:hypothetical protein
VAAQVVASRVVLSSTELVSNVCISGKRYLKITPFRQNQLPWYTKFRKECFKDSVVITRDRDRQEDNLKAILSE